MPADKDWEVANIRHPDVHVPDRGGNLAVYNIPKENLIEARKGGPQNNATKRVFNQKSAFFNYVHCFGIAPALWWLRDNISTHAPKLRTIGYVVLASQGVCWLFKRTLLNAAPYDYNYSFINKYTNQNGVFINIVHAGVIAPLFFAFAKRPYKFYELAPYLIVPMFGYHFLALGMKLTGFMPWWLSIDTPDFAMAYNPVQRSIVNKFREVNRQRLESGEEPLKNYHYSPFPYYWMK